MSQSLVLNSAFSNFLKKIFFNEVDFSQSNLSPTKGKTKNLKKFDKKKKVLLRTELCHPPVKGNKISKELQRRVQPHGPDLQSFYMNESILSSSVVKPARGGT